MNRNPIYQALRNTRVLETLGRSYRNDPRVAGADAIASRKLDHILDLHELGVIDHKELIALKERAMRPYHAAILRVARAALSLEKRSGAISKVQRLCPPGISSYDFRMARDARA